MISKLINTSSFALILVCFLLPFISIRCNDTTLAEFKGYHLVTGKEYTIKSPVKEAQNNTADDMGNEEKGELKTNWLMVVVLVIAVVGMTIPLTRLKDRRTPQIILSVTGILSLIILVILIGNELESKGAVGNALMGLNITLHREVGFWFMFILFLIIIVHNSVLLVIDSKRQIPTASPLNDYNEPPPIDKIE